MKTLEVFLIMEKICLVNMSKQEGREDKRHVLLKLREEGGSDWMLLEKLNSSQHKRDYKVASISDNLLYQKCGFAGCLNILPWVNKKCLIVSLSRLYQHGENHMQLSLTQIIRKAKSKSILKKAKDLSQLQAGFTDSFLIIGDTQHGNNEHIKTRKK